MKSIFVIVKQVSERGGHGQGSTEYEALAYYHAFADRQDAVNVINAMPHTSQFFYKVKEIEVK